MAVYAERAGKCYGVDTVGHTVVMAPTDEQRQAADRLITASIAANRARVRTNRLENFILWMSLVPVGIVVLAVLVIGGVLIFG